MSGYVNYKMSTRTGSQNLKPDSFPGIEHMWDTMMLIDKGPGEV